MSSHSRRDEKRERGAALIVAVVALLMGVMIAISAMEHTQEESTSGARSRNTARTLHAADAGIEFALARLAQSPPDLTAFSVDVDGISVESRRRSEGSPQPILQDTTGAPPAGYAINVGSDTGYGGRVYQVNVTATSGSSAAELEVRFRRLEAGAGSY